MQPNINISTFKVTHLNYIYVFTFLQDGIFSRRIACTKDIDVFLIFILYNVMNTNET